MSGIQTPASPAGIEAKKEPVAPVGDDQQPAADANPTDSSAVDEGAKGPASLLDVVRSAVEPESEPVKSPVTEGEGEAAPAAAAEQAQEGAEAAAAEEDAEVPFHNHPRWKALTAERDALRDDATSFQGIQSFMADNNLSGEEVAEGYEIMALIKRGDRGSLEKALEWFEPRVAHLREQLGAVLPDDLAERVESGELDEADANALARGRADTRFAEAEQVRRQQEADAARAAETTQANGVELARAVQEWEDQTKAADPDYAKKAGMVLTMSRAIIQERGGKYPSTKDEAVQLAKDAYERVNQTFADLVPKPRPVTPSPTGVSTPTPAAAPTSLKDAIRAAVAQ